MAGTSARADDTDTVFGRVLEQTITGLGLTEDEAGCFRVRFGDLIARPGPLDPARDAEEVLAAIATAENECLSPERRDEIVSSDGRNGPSTADLDQFTSAVEVVADDATTDQERLVAAAQTACRTLADLGLPLSAFAAVVAQDTALADQVSQELSVDLGTVLAPAQMIAFVTLAVPSFCPLFDL